MSKYKFLLITIIVFGLLSIGIIASAEDDTTIDLNDTIINQVLTESVDLANETEALEGVEIEEPKSIPSGFGIWWLNLREKVSLGLTFNPVKKAERRLMFAEQRMKLAEYMIQNSAEVKVQEKAQQMIERANKYIQKIEERKDDILSGSDQKVRTLMDNVVKHYLNKEKVLEKIEDKISPEKLEQFQQLRQTIEERRETFLENLENNPNVSQEIKDKVSETSQRIENIKQEREEIRQEQKDLLEEIKTGNQEAREAFQQIREEKEQITEQVRQQFKEEKTEIINEIKEGNNTAIERLRQLNQEQKQEIEENREQIRQQIQNKVNQ